MVKLFKTKKSTNGFIYSKINYWNYELIKRNHEKNYVDIYKFVSETKNMKIMKKAIATANNYIVIAHGLFKKILESSHCLQN